MKKLILASNIIILFIVFISISGCKKETTQDDPKDTPLIFNPSVAYGSLTDYDGNTYKTVQIGLQIWMAENLRVTHYRNGDPIIKVTDETTWIFEGAYCYYKDDSTKMAETRGALYNGYVLNNTHSLCPSGWHVSTDEDWNILINYLGGENSAGKLKECGTTHWAPPNSDATNSTGFTAIPVGLRESFLFYKDDEVEFWTPSEEDSLFGLRCRLDTDCQSIDRLPFYHEVEIYQNCLSIRCVKD